jgi:hypothetical protein
MKGSPVRDVDVRKDDPSIVHEWNAVHDRWPNEGLHDGSPETFDGYGLPCGQATTSSPADSQRRSVGTSAIAETPTSR